MMGCCLMRSRMTASRDSATVGGYRVLNDESWPVILIRSEHRRCRDRPGGIFLPTKPIVARRYDENAMVWHGVRADEIRTGDRVVVNGRFDKGHWRAYAVSSRTD